MTRLWAATHHEEAADVEEGVPGSRRGPERRRTRTNEEPEWAAPGVIDVDDRLVVEY